MGLPVLLVAPPGEASAIVVQENVGLWISAGNSKEFTTAIQKLYSDPALLKQYSKNALQTAPKYSREQQAKNMLVELAP